MKIAILHNAVSDGSAPDEQDVLVQADAVLNALTRLGHEAYLLACDLNLGRLKRQLETRKPDLVFNLVESLEGQGRLIHLVPFLLDALDLAYTGAPAEAIYATSNKLSAKTLLSTKQLPTPEWGVVDSKGEMIFQPEQNEPWDATTTFIVKSVWEHASLGLGGDGLVRFSDQITLGRIMEQRAPELGGRCFAERYIDGREFNLAMLAGSDGPQVLAPAEIIFENYGPDQARIVCYRAKWEEASFEYNHTPRRFEFSDDDFHLLERLSSAARECWRLFNLKGYARVDFRVDSQNQIWILEVNTNPCLSPDAGFYAALERSNITFEQAVARIVSDSFAPGGIRVGKEDNSAPQSSSTNQFPSYSQIASIADSDRFFKLRETVKPSDLDQVRQLVMNTGFFLPMEVEVAVELVRDRLEKGPDCGYNFLFWDEGDQLAAYACFGPIPCTQFSYDLYWIAVNPDSQRSGRGTRLIEAVETEIAKLGGRQIYVETSQRPLYENTRKFYQRCGYETAAVLADFYGPNDGKIVFLKKLS